MSEKKSSKNDTKIDVLVPLTSFLITDNFAGGEGDPVSVSQSFDIPNTDIKLLVLSKRMRCEENTDIQFDSELCLSKQNFRINKMMPRPNSYQFNSCLHFSFIQSEPDQISIFPHTFEQKVQRVITLMRLFTPGELFAPYAFIDGVDTVDLYEFRGGGNGLSHINQRNVPNFLNFYDRYSNLAEKLRQDYEKTPDSVTAIWFKRINNAIYFFGQTYFTLERNNLSSNSQHGNNLRLIYLCTALEALLGENAGRKALGERAHRLLGWLSPKINDEIVTFYVDRSNYIHANPAKLKSMFSDAEIDKLTLYIQKLILVSLELSGNVDFLKILSDHKMKEWYSPIIFETAYQKHGIESLVHKALIDILAYKDMYELGNSQFIDTRIRIWKSGRPGFTK